MGLDMRPLGKPRVGFEERFVEIFNLISKEELPKPSFFGKLLGKKYPTKEELLKEWFENQIPSYETIKAPCVGRDIEADEWAKERYEKLQEKPSFDEYMKNMDGYYVIELAKELDGVPVYCSLNEDGNVFRGQFLEYCISLIGKELVYEAWETKLADDALDYGNRLMAVAEKIAKENNLEYLKDQRFPSDDAAPDSMECQLHIVFSLAKWLIFYGKNGHGYEAYY